MLENSKIHTKSIEAVLAKAKQLLFELLSKPHSTPKDFPSRQGVYLIYNTTGKIIYVGKASNLKRRITSDHISGEMKISTSTFRRKVAKLHGILPGPDMRKWINDNCKFAYVEVEDADMCDMVESLTILLLRVGNKNLMNYTKK